MPSIRSWSVFASTGFMGWYRRPLGRGSGLALDPPLGDPACGWFSRPLGPVPFSLEESLSRDWDSTPLSVLGPLSSSNRTLLRGMRAGIFFLFLVGLGLSSRGSLSSLMARGAGVESHQQGIPLVVIMAAGDGDCCCGGARAVTGEWRGVCGGCTRGSSCCQS